KRPYELIPKTAVEVVEPTYYDANGTALPPDVAGQEVAVSVYDIRIRPGILYQPHPAFARNSMGDYVYWPISPHEIEGKYALTDFPAPVSRVLAVLAFVYAFRRLAILRVISLIFGVMANLIAGMSE